MSEWHPRHRVMFAELATRAPYGLSRDELRIKWDAHFPYRDGRTFAATLRALENAGLIEANLTDALADLVGDVR